MRHTLLSALLLCTAATAVAQTEVTIDFSGNNTSSDYITYDQAISLPSYKTVNVKMARYCYFNSTITGSGTLNLYAGGERCYIGTKGGSTWANWSSYSGRVHVHPFRENSSSAGSFNIVLAHGGKAFSPENVEEAIQSGRLNNAMQNNRVTLHAGAVICTEANSTNAGGFRIGELQTEEGSTLQGYMKKSRASYYLLGCLNTDATLAGTIAPTDYRDDTALGLIKEGKGTYRITGNDNYLSGALRVMAGRVLVMNDRAKTEQQKTRGALGARSNANDAIAYVFEGGVLGGTGSIGGAVDNYGTIEPGDDAPGLLTLQNYKTPSLAANLFVRPASVLRFKVASASAYDQLAVSGTVKYYNQTQDFNVSDKMPVVQLSLAESFEGEVGMEFTLLTAKSKTGDWHFDLQQPDRYTWQLEEREVGGLYTLVLRLTSLEKADNPDNPDNPDDPSVVSTIGALYDDGVDENSDQTTLREYAQQNNKCVGVALSTWKTDITNESLAETKEAGKQFNMLVAENEMKMDALQPNRGEFSFWAADNLVSFAQRHQMSVRGHCLVWHQQQPQWVSSDGKKNDKNWSRSEALAIMKDHITTVLQHFKGKVTEWDVVNECLDEDQSVIRSNPEGYTLRQNVWQRAIGDDYIDSAFVYARRADPAIQLYLNDYGVELQGKAKSVAFYNLVKHLQQRNIPLDGVGLQCHFSIGEVDSVKLASTVKRFGEAGLKCIVTELDMGVSSVTTANLEEQGRNYRVITDIMLDNDNFTHIIIWGLKDNDSWRTSSNPLLYTSGLDKKLAWYSVRSALRHHLLADDTTGIDAIAPRTSDLVSPTSDYSAVYDLQGRRVDSFSLKKGVYIQQGRKIMMK